MIAYKLFRLRKDGTLGPLFINSKQVIKPGVRYQAEAHSTPGFKFRPGWHCCSQPKAPHLTIKGRVWARVSVTGVTKHKRPESQGGLWYTAKTLKVLDFVDFDAILGQIRFIERMKDLELMWLVHGDVLSFHRIAYDGVRVIPEVLEIEFPMVLFTTPKPKAR